MITPSVNLARSLLLSAASCAIAAACFVTGPRNLSAQEEESAPNEASGELEAAFKELLSGATLVGHFTMTGRSTSDLKEERYNIESVEKIANGRWLFRARIRYGDHDVTVPLPLPVKWAGDTPMIVVDKLQIPGMGTFDARVMLFKNHYAGYWAHGEHGGHLFGVIERGADGEKESTEEKPAGAAEEKP